MIIPGCVKFNIKTTKSCNITTYQPQPEMTKNQYTAYVLFSY
jgi:hypothetical protein